MKGNFALASCLPNWARLTSASNSAEEDGSCIARHRDARHSGRADTLHPDARGRKCQDVSFGRDERQPGVLCRRLRGERGAHHLIAIVQGNDGCRSAPCGRCGDGHPLHDTLVGTESDRCRSVNGGESQNAFVWFQVYEGSEGRTGGK